MSATGRDSDDWIYFPEITDDEDWLEAEADEHVPDYPADNDPAGVRYAIVIEFRNATEWLDVRRGHELVGGPATVVIDDDSACDLRGWR